MAGTMNNNSFVKVLVPPVSGWLIFIEPWKNLGIDVAVEIKVLKAATNNED